MKCDLVLFVQDVLILSERPILDALRGKLGVLGLGSQGLGLERRQARDGAHLFLPKRIRRLTLGGLRDKLGAAGLGAAGLELEGLQGREAA